MIETIETRELTTKSFTKEDGKGNIILARFILLNSVPNVCEVYLKLAAEERRRRLGVVSLEKGIYMVKRKRSKHLHNLSNSYGFNYEILNEQHLFKIRMIHIIETDTGMEYMFYKDVIDSFGRFMNYQQQGFELQRFISLDFLKSYNIIKKEKHEND